MCLCVGGEFAAFPQHRLAQGTTHRLIYTFLADRPGVHNKSGYRNLWYLLLLLYSSIRLSAQAKIKSYSHCRGLKKFVLRNTASKTDHMIIKLEVRSKITRIRMSICIKNMKTAINSKRNVGRTPNLNSTYT